MGSFRPFGGTSGCCLTGLRPFGTRPSGTGAKPPFGGKPTPFLGPRPIPKPSMTMMQRLKDLMKRKLGKKERLEGEKTNWKWHGNGKAELEAFHNKMQGYLNKNRRKRK